MGIVTDEQNRRTLSASMVLAESPPLPCRAPGTALLSICKLESCFFFRINRQGISSLSSFLFVTVIKNFISSNLERKGS